MIVNKKKILFVSVFLILTIYGRIYSKEDNFYQHFFENPIDLQKSVDKFIKKILIQLGFKKKSIQSLIFYKNFLKKKNKSYKIFLN